MSFLKKYQAFRKRNESTKKQKIILWGAIITASLYFLITLAIVNGQTTWSYIECPADSYGDCLNALYDCKHPPIGYAPGADNLCPNPADQATGRAICNKNPLLCESRTIPNGTTIGEKPPAIIENLPIITSIILIIGFIGYIIAGRKQ